ncbi:MAG: holo-ACP synthase [Bacteroidota bacterium]
MIIGIGTDLVDVSRIEKLVLESDGFKERVFSEDEISYCESGKNRFERYAARFAAKEAFAKALGVGIFGGIPMNAVSVIHGKNQKPELHLDPNFASRIPILEGAKVLLSISHDSTHSIAFVVLENQD